MTKKQTMCVDEAIKCLQNARKWLDQAMYYSGDEMPVKELEKVRESYSHVCQSIDLL